MKTKSLSAKKSAGSKHHASRPTITTQLDLLSWLYDRLDQLEPRVAVNEHVLAGKEELLELLQDDEYIDYPPVYWVDFFIDVCWSEQANPTVPRCGAKLLMFMGLLGEAIRRNEGAHIPIPRGIEMMLECGLEVTKYLVDRSTKSRRWIETTTLGLETFGCAIKVEMPRRRRLYDLWDLSEDYF